MPTLCLGGAYSQTHCGLLGVVKHVLVKPYILDQKAPLPSIVKRVKAVLDDLFF